MTNYFLVHHVSDAQAAREQPVIALGMIAQSVFE
jgi:hypothetical protein